MPNRTWRGQSHGGALGHRLVAVAARCGLLPMYAFVAFPALWFLWRDGEARGHSDAYWRLRRPDLGRWGRLVETTFQFHGFACMLADRLAAVRWPRTIRQEHRGAEAMAAAMRSGQGCILLSAHLGNWELSGRWLTRYGIRINIVMLDAEDPAVQAELARTMGDHPFRVLDLRRPNEAAVAIAGALQAGETCCMLADRHLGDGGHTLRLPFLGRPARFPLGPFLAAAVTGAWIVPTFAVKEGLNRYAMTAFSPYRITQSGRAQRKAAVEQAARRWVRILEAMVRRHPRQWHNFHDFWA